MEKLVAAELKEKQVNPQYQKLLEREHSKLKELTEGLQPGRMVGVRDLLNNPSHFGLTAK